MVWILIVFTLTGDFRQPIVVASFKTEVNCNLAAAKIDREVRTSLNQVVYRASCIRGWK